jgi:hypothetical protein
MAAMRAAAGGASAHLVGAARERSEAGGAARGGTDEVLAADSALPRAPPADARSGVPRSTARMLS